MSETNLQILDASEELVKQEFKGLLSEALSSSFGIDNVEELTSIVITNEQVKYIKEMLATARSYFKKEDDLRKKIKEAVNEKYKAYEALFKCEFKAPLDQVIDYYDTQVKDIENEEIKQKTSKLLTYLEVQTKGTILEDRLSLETLGITKVLKSKSLKEYQEIIDREVTRINNDLISMDSLEFGKYVKAEYMKHFNLAKAIEDGKRLAEELEPKEDTAVSTNVEATSEDLELIKVALEFNAPKAKIKALKQFLKDNDIDYRFLY